MLWKVERRESERIEREDGGGMKAEEAREWRTREEKEASFGGLVPESVRRYFRTATGTHSAPSLIRSLAGGPTISRWTGSGVNGGILISRLQFGDGDADGDGINNGGGNVGGCGGGGGGATVKNRTGGRIVDSTGGHWGAKDERRGGDD
ncbi:predicted protein [Histoplasma mississippiense (nom. inval.)]|uniref:predicted protein n=1 Tax=Ajellomyces capsulatus (strain NAm1 / WU24) TaxID=2059318 RepID=UPI000157C5CF|nr:predicted protein [Histoplasma mississippiense (nom. inval.)]EDN08782.1 predicted protein [Histoplasma mississippiense (nom. inval.)]